MSEPSGPPVAGEPGPIEAFWNLARFHAKLNTAPTYFGPTTLEVVTPPAWSFGSTPELADELATLVLEGVKTATASTLAEFEAESQPLPEVGGLSIVLDGAGHPQALVETTAVAVVPFDQVDAEHARLEGEGDGSLEQWREVHARVFDITDPGTLLVLERFRVVYRAD